MAQRKFKIAASLICGNHASIKEDVVVLEKGKVDYLHFDVMDGIFVPRYGLYPELLKAIKEITVTPIDVHMMTEEPARYIKEFAEAGADIIAVHAEACKHLHHTLKIIRDAGARAGVVLNYATPLSVLDCIMDDIDMVELMAINPGIVGHKLIPGTIKKIAELRRRIDESGKDIFIEIDGGVSPESAPEMVRAGADVLVCGTSVIYKKEKPLDEKIKELRELVNSKQ